MQVVVVYESMFGNTKIIAEAIAEGLWAASDPGTQVEVLPVEEATHDKLKNVGLLIVGAPTNLRRVPSSRIRKQFPARPGVRQWLKTLSAVPTGRQAAAFDTRFSRPLAGSTARSICRRLQRHGYEIVARPAGFFVEQRRGPLTAKERERARAWGACLVRQ
jgi:hypothetical protein